VKRHLTKIIQFFFSNSDNFKQLYPTNQVYEDHTIMILFYIHNRENKSLAHHRLQLEGRSQVTNLSKWTNNLCPKKKEDMLGSKTMKEKKNWA
jgi:hypothetical protein